MQCFYHSEYKLAKLQKKNLDSSDETRSFEKANWHGVTAMLTVQDEKCMHRKMQFAKTLTSGG